MKIIPSTQDSFSLTLRKLQTPRCVGIGMQPAQEKVSELIRELRSSYTFASHEPPSPGLSSILPSKEVGVLPNSFGDIYLGDILSFNMTIKNVSSQIVENVVVQVTVHNHMQELILSDKQPRSQLIGVDSEFEQPIHHEIKATGPHILAFEIYFRREYSVFIEKFRKYFKFDVLQHLDVKTRLYKTAEEELFLQTRVQNVGPQNVYLEKVTIENLSAVKTEVKDFIQNTQLRNSASISYWYLLKPKMISQPLDTVTKLTIGNTLKVYWHTDSTRQVETTSLKNITVINSSLQGLQVDVIKAPRLGALGEVFELGLDVTNITEKDVRLSFYIHPSSAFDIQETFPKVLYLAPKDDNDVTLRIIPLATGDISCDIYMTDAVSNQMHFFENIIKLTVTNNGGASANH